MSTIPGKTAELTAADRDKIVAVLKVRAEEFRAHAIRYARISRPSEIAMMKAEATWLEAICEKLFLAQHANFNEWSDNSGKDLS